MTWSARQRRMLAAMGIRLWEPAPATVGGEAAAKGVGSVAAATPAVVRGEEVDVAAPGPSVVVPVPAPALALAPASAPRPQGVTGSAATVPDRERPADAPPPAPTASLPVDAEALARRAATISALDWAGLKEAVAGCTACGLCAGRRQTVFGVGHARAHWMIVGEAPGEQEDLAGEPFVGPAGQLLDQMLRAAGLSRRAPDGSKDEDAGDPARRVFIANTLKCRPPRNRNPEPDELLQCEPFLRRQVALVQPKIILALGRFAVKTLLGSDEAIGKLRGRVHRYEGLPVVVSYHPAYLLRNLPDKAKAWDDLCLAMAAAERA